jgi:glycosyltransferase involved in cell wall biosynthesis
MSEMLQSEELRRRRRRAGIVHAAQFRWDSSAAQLEEIYAALLDA